MRRRRFVGSMVGTRCGRRSLYLRACNLVGVDDSIDDGRGSDWVGLIIRVFDSPLFGRGSVLLGASWAVIMFFVQVIQCFVHLAGNSVYLFGKVAKGRNGLLAFPVFGIFLADFKGYALDLVEVRLES